jgi:site-specific recombinase XerD
MKESNSYVFTSEANHYQILSHETITKDVNRVMCSVSNQFTDKPNSTSHSFRIGYIPQLWKDSKDNEFVKQTIGHRSMDTTYSYVDILSDKEREEGMDQI